MRLSHARAYLARRSALGQERRILAFPGMSAVTLNPDICLRRNI